jgi:hypothetical protein
MRALTKSEAKKWCQTQGTVMGSGGFPNASCKTESFGIPTDSGQRVASAARHLECFRGNGKTLVWFDDWAVWPSGQRMHIFERFLASYGETRPLIKVPAFLFEKYEHEDLVSFVTLGVLFLWDIYVVGTKTRRLLHYSHDEVGWIKA